MGGRNGCRSVQILDARVSIPVLDGNDPFLSVSEFSGGGSPLVFVLSLLEIGEMLAGGIGAGACGVTGGVAVVFATAGAGSSLEDVASCFEDVYVSSSRR